VYVWFFFEIGYIYKHPILDGSTTYSFSKPWYYTHNVSLTDTQSGQSVRFVREEKFSRPFKMSQEGELISLQLMEEVHLTWLLGVYSFEGAARYTYGPQGLLGPRERDDW
jgi:hypothetical protein